MIDETTAVAKLARRAVLATFDPEDASARVRVNCLERAEISALVASLRNWLPPCGQEIRVAVTAHTPWDGLREEDVVPRGDESPTTLRNALGTWVVLIEGDDYTDKQSWANVLQISDHDLLATGEARRYLASLFFGEDLAEVLVEVLEDLHQVLAQHDGGHIPVRDWVGLTRALAQGLGDAMVLDPAKIWAEIGSTLPAGGLFADDRLGEANMTDRKRMLRRNARESGRIVSDSDEGWRDRLRELVDRIEFVERDGSLANDQAVVRAAATKVLDRFGRDATLGLQFRYWEQLIEGGKSRRGLGTRIREQFELTAPDRVKEFEELDVVEGIDANRADDAERLLSHVPEDENLPPLPSLLNGMQRSALERMAKPRAPRTTRPLSDLVRVIADMVAERDTLGEDTVRADTAVLEIAPRLASADTLYSRGLFAWLFGPTLRELANLTADESLSLRVSEDLVRTIEFSPFEREEDTEEGENADALAVLELRLKWSDGIGSERRIEWNPEETPGLVGMRRFCARHDVVYWAPSQGATFPDWIAGALQRIPMLGANDAPVVEGTSEIVLDFDRVRDTYLKRLHEAGLSFSIIGDYVGEYRELLKRVREQYVPAGVGTPEVEQFLLRDFYVGDDTAACLATHPLRLRWVAAYLERMSELVLRALRRELVTNPVNPELFFDQILDATPQAQPPVVVFGERLLIAVREQDWQELYAPLKDSRGEKRDWLADLDDGAIDEVADTIGRYLDAYPYKADGLHLLLVVRRHGARGLHRLVKRVLERSGVAGASLKLSLFVDTAETRSVEQVLQDFDDPDHRALSNRPPLQVDLHPWRDPEVSLPDVRGVGPFVDVAVVPNLFGASTRTQESTISGRHQAGHFQTLLDEPTRLEPVRASGGKSTTVSRVLLPQGQDELLESWSTIVTRQFRGSPVSESPREDDVDHVMIRVSLDRKEEREFFSALHACSHWVLTVDAFVGREQIESLDGAPDVIQVKTGVGANGAYRMVVSSKIGREFIESRVARRLREQLSPALLPDPVKPAVEIYRRASLLVPGVVLRSLGLGRTTAEMVGLVLARARVEQVDPALVGPHGFQSWISLDEHTDWSGGHTKVRADLLRFRGRMDGERLKLRIDVVEAKMRPQPAVGRADGQLNRSIELIKAAFGGEPGSGVDYADCELWSRLIWRAIDQSSAAADETPAATHTVTKDGRIAGLDQWMHAALRLGDCDIESVEGILVSLTNDSLGADRRTPSGHRWLQMTMEEVAQTLTGLSDSREYPLHLAPAQILGSASAVDELVPRSGVSGSDDCHQQHAEVGQQGEISDSLTLPVTPRNESDRPRRGGATPRAHQRLQQLIDALHLRNVEVKPADKDRALEGPGFYVFRIELGRDVRPETVFGLETHLQYQLGLEAGQRPRLYVDRGAMVVEIPKRADERYYVAAEDLWDGFEWRSDRLAAPIGSDVRDQVVAIDFSSSRSPHLLIGGMTGGGKSVALEALLLGLVRNYSPEQLELRIVDPKGNEFTQFDGMAHVPDSPGMDAEDAIDMLERTCNEMDARYRAMKQLSREKGERVRDIAAYNALIGSNNVFKWILVVLDEFADLTADKEDKKVIEGLLQRIAQKARACGIHAIVATQKPSAEVISTTTRSNLGAQLALRVRSATDSRVIMEASGAESLAGNGDGFLRLSGEEPIRIQCAKAD